MAIQGLMEFLCRTRNHLCMVSGAVKPFNNLQLQSGPVLDNALPGSHKTGFGKLNPR